MFPFFRSSVSLLEGSAVAHGSVLDLEELEPLGLVYLAVLRCVARRQYGPHVCVNLGVVDGLALCLIELFDGTLELSRLDLTTVILVKHLEHLLQRFFLVVTHLHGRLLG
jgi:hypothetical protein